MEAYCHRTGKPAWRLMETIRRDYLGLSVYPLAWVSHHWQQATAIFADLTHFPKRQVFRRRERDDLTGFHDAAEFDFRSHAGLNGLRRPRRQRQPVLASA